MLRNIWKKQLFMKTGALLMAVAMTMTALYPSYSYAEEVDSVTTAEEVTEADMSAQQETEDEDLPPEEPATETAEINAAGQTPMTIAETPTEPKAVTPKVKRFTFAQNGQTVDENTSIDIEVELETGIEATQIVVIIEEEYSVNGVFCSSVQSSSTHTVFRSDENNTFANYDNGTHSISGVCLDWDEYFAGNMFQMDAPESYTFTVQKKDNVAPVITKLEFAENGKTLKAGETINLTVYATDDKQLNDDGYVILKYGGEAGEDWDYARSHKQLWVYYDEETGAYTGKLTIPEDMEKGQWYIEEIEIRDAAFNSADFTGYGSETDHPYSFTLEEGIYIPEKRTIAVMWNYLQDNGAWYNIASSDVEVPGSLTWGEIKQELLKGAPTNHYPGLKLQKWEFCQGFDNQDVGWEDSYIPTSQSLAFTMKATYDKNFLAVEYQYPRQDGSSVTVRRPLFYDQGDTVAEAVQKAKEYRPEDMLQDSSFEWRKDSIFDSAYNVPDDATVLDGNYTLFLQASYKGKKTVFLGEYYWDTQGIHYHESAILLDEKATAKELLEMVKQKETPSMYNGLRFTGWTYGSNNFFGEMTPEGVASWNLEDGDSITRTAQYENCMIQYGIDPRYVNSTVYLQDKDLETIICQVVEKGTEITIPDKLPGYSTITWKSVKAGEQVKVTGDLFYRGYGQKLSKELPEEVVEKAVAEIEKAENGQNVVVEMTEGATVLPKDVIEAAKGKNVDVTLDMGGYTWTINGKDITSVPSKDLDMEVIVGTQNIPEKTVQSLAGENPTKQITLLHEGEFGFKATLTVNIGDEYSGLYGNLFYCDKEGKLTYISSGWIKENGEVSLEFTHASDYVLVMSKTAMSEADIPVSLRPATPQSPSNNQNAGLSSNPGGGENVPTGDTTVIAPFVVSAVVALGMLLLLTRKRKYGSAER